MENKTTTTQQEIDLATIMKSLAKQKGLIFIITLLCTLIVLAFQFSKLAFYAPEQLNYPIAIEFISENNIKYPNKTPFSASDIIAPVNVKEVAKELSIEQNMKPLLTSLSVKNGNQLIKIARESLLEQINYNKKQPKEMLKPIKQTLSELKRISATYLTLSLNLREADLTVQEGEQLLKRLVENWEKRAISRGLISPGVSYPHMPFSLDEDTGIVNNYDHLYTYANTMIKAFNSFSSYSGARSLMVEGYNINDLQIKLNNLVNKEIKIMRAYSYSQSSLMEDGEYLMEANVFAQSNILALKKDELKKRMANYSELINSINSASGDGSSSKDNTGRANSLPTQTQIDQGVLNDLLDLGSKVSTIDLKKDLIERRLKISEELFDVEKEISIIRGFGGDDTSYPLDNRKQVIAILPTLLNRSIAKVNKIHNIFVKIVAEYANMGLQKGITLYSPLGDPKLSNRFDLSFSSIILMSLIGALLGLVIGLIVALFRTLLQNGKTI